MTLNKPLADRILLKELPKEEMTETGLYIPDSVTIPLSKGKVKEAGVKCEEVQDGDVILFDTGAGTTIVIDKEEYRFIREMNAVAVIERDSERSGIAVKNEKGYSSTRGTK